MKMLIMVFSLFLCALMSCATFQQNSQTMQASNTADLTWPSPPDKPRIHFLQSISGSADMGMKKTWFKKAFDSLLGHDESEETMLRPYGVAASFNKIYVTDPALSVVHIFDLENKRYKKIDNAGGQELISPLGVAVDTNGEVYITDSVLKQVFIFDGIGKFMRKIGSEALFMRPTGIAVDSNRVYVVDTLEHQVLVFSKSDGTLLFRIGHNGTNNDEFNYPTHIFVSKNKIYITDSLNFRIQIFDASGKFLRSYGRLGDAMGDFSKPKGVAVDSQDHIYVADSQYDNIQIFDETGKLLLVLGSTGRSLGKFVLPSGIFIDGKDRIYVADSYNKRVQIFQYLAQ